MQPLNTLVLLTESFPYDVAYEQTFPKPEIPVLAANFDQLVIVPRLLKGEKCIISENVEIDESFARFCQQKLSRLKGLIQAGFMILEELRSNPSLWRQPKALKRLTVYTIDAELMRLWVLQFIAKQKLNPNQVIFYTYWLSCSCTGIGLVKKYHPQLRLVSRSHSADLYEELANPPYLPYRGLSLRNLDFLFPDSFEGEEYISRRYPWFASRCETARQGVKDPGFITLASNDNVFRIASCSFLIPRKRVNLLLQGIIQLAQSRPAQAIEWYHIGDGPLRSDLEKIIVKLLPNNVKGLIMGYLQPDHMMAFYRDNPIDVSVNVSSNEGTPVSLMEVASCGIPIVATAVGGNSEIVSDENGRLLTSNPTPTEVAEAFLQLIDYPVKAAQKRQGSRRVWQEKYNSAHNFQLFADRLKAIRNGTLEID